MGKFVDLTGKKFHRLTVIKRLENKIYKNGSQKARWLCKCECGKESIVASESLTGNHIKSCGCLKLETLKKVNTKHGGKHTRLYRTWIGIKTRCYNKNEYSYKDYGGRGIIVCDEWVNDFQAFHDWAIENGYDDNLTIDRIDVNGNYEPINCRWADKNTQMNNTTRSHYLEYNGETHTIAEWSKIKGLKYSTFFYRIKRGWSIEKALTEPSKKQ